GIGMVVKKGCCVGGEGEGDGDGDDEGDDWFCIVSLFLFFLNESLDREPGAAPPDAGRTGEADF
ncbi:hypothetical protein CMV_015066, partial [Castanea mollissima]